MAETYMCCFPLSVLYVAGFKLFPLNVEIFSHWEKISQIRSPFIDGFFLTDCTSGAF